MQHQQVKKRNQSHIETGTEHQSAKRLQEIASELVDEILTLVFKYLFAPQILAASEVCKNWKRICKKHYPSWDRNFRETFDLWSESIESIPFTGEYKMGFAYVYAVQSREFYHRSWTNVCALSSCSYLQTRYLDWFSTLPNFMRGRRTPQLTQLWNLGVPVSEWEKYAAKNQSYNWGTLAIDENTSQKELVAAFDYYCVDAGTTLTIRGIFNTFMRVWDNPAPHFEFLKHISKKPKFLEQLAFFYRKGLSVEQLSELCKTAAFILQIPEAYDMFPGSDLLIDVLQTNQKIHVEWWVHHFEKNALPVQRNTTVRIVRFLVKYRIIFQVLAASSLFKKSAQTWHLRYTSGAIELLGIFTTADHEDLHECIEPLLPVTNSIWSHEIIKDLFRPKPIPNVFWGNRSKLNLKELYDAQRSELEHRFPPLV